MNATNIGPIKKKQDAKEARPVELRMELAKTRAGITGRVATDPAGGSSIEDDSKAFVPRR